MKTAGFTLVETIIYIAIIGMFLTAFTFFSLDMSGLEGEINESLEVSAGASFLVQTIERLVKESTFIIEPNPSATSSILALNHNDYGDIEISSINNRVYITDSDDSWALSAGQVSVTGLEFGRSAGGSNKISFQFGISSLDPTAVPLIIQSTVKKRQ